jgi:hypothetical protein
MKVCGKLIGAALALFLAVAAHHASAATISVSAQGVPDTLNVGETATVTVTAEVTDPASGTDGIFTFDLDLLFDTSVLSVVLGSMDRPDVDDLSFGGSDGSSAAFGINAIAGGYWPFDIGLAGPQTLFTVELQADAVGNTSVAASPDTDIMGVDFVLNETTSPTIDYSGATTNVTVVPEPASLALLLGTAGFMVRRRNSRLRHG